MDPNHPENSQKLFRPEVESMMMMIDWNVWSFNDRGLVKTVGLCDLPINLDYITVSVMLTL
jgi:hypothetical protein